ncbi:4-alpha-glucanotransferase [Pseudorhizobium tarimense]|uniref:4-alpha-glucanotransferase n=1 Tax=Pseudorhizobium tarimense TaxID=1079109 RepID=A0ABV2HAU5_9HYPH|nr:4-alpha-glucanotransferase [Pseudorhizobium tarimense]MCJ8520787.1 4-alpha-glucanotransferase [Pseudorhizobium tarimense]
MGKNDATAARFGFDDLAALYGVPPDYEDLQSEVRPVPEETRRRILKALGAPDNLNALRQAASEREPPRLELKEPTVCYLPESLQNAPVWGISLQLYELKSSRNWGIGDFADLRQICTIAAAAGADFIGLNPLHALFLAEPERCSPYSPSSRVFLNPLYIAVDQVNGFEPDGISGAELERLRAAELVDYPAVTDLKLRALKAIWNRRSSIEKGAEEFDRFKSEHGQVLHRHAVFETLSLHLKDSGHQSGWHHWPGEFQGWSSDGVRQFAEEHADEVEFHQWLQWLAAKQLAEVTDHTREVGMKIGLYFDLAVGEAPDGSSTWCTPELGLQGLRVGAPPDVFSTSGQDWGLIALSPQALQEQGMKPYRELIDASMRYAGALRIDHAMGIWQLFLLPEGETPAVGGYLRYPFQDMVSVLAEVSHARRSVVIGEDLGNVPDGFRDVMEEAQILGYRVLYFEEADPEGFDVSNIIRLSLACLSTHDLPPLIGWWRGDDIDLALKVGLTEPVAAEKAREERAQRRQSFVTGLAGAGLLEQNDADEKISEEAVIAIHRLLARSPSVMVALRLADLVGEDQPTNVPGTSDAYPNWRRKLSVPVEELAGSRLFRRIVEAVAAVRPKTSL